MIPIRDAALTALRVFMYPFVLFFKKAKDLKNRDIKTILVLDRNRIGDLLFTTPALSCLRSTYKNSKISVLIYPECEALLLRNRDIDDIILFNGKRNFINELKMISNIKSRKFDLVVNFELTVKATFSANLIKGKLCCGADVKGYGFVLDFASNDDKNAYWPHVYLDIIKGLGLKSENTDMKIDVCDSDTAAAKKFLEENNISKDDFIVCVHPGASMYWKTKQWPMENFIKLANSILKNCKVKIMLTGDANDKPLIEEISRSLIAPVVMAISLNLRELFCVIRMSNIMISNDTGPMHLAVIANIALVALFGPTMPARILPKRDNIAAIKSNSYCSSCQAPECSRKKAFCMNDITVDRVLSAYNTLVNKHTGT